MKTKNKRFRKTKCNKSRKTRSRNFTPLRIENAHGNVTLSVQRCKKTRKNKDYNGGMWPFTKRSNNPSESSWFSWFSRPKKTKQDVMPQIVGIDSNNLEDHLSEEELSKLSEEYKLSKLSELSELSDHCLDSNFCITYTREHNAKVLSYFDNFKILPKYLKESKQIGSSLNGIIFAVIYEKNDYVVNAVFKCSQISKYGVTHKKYRVADNLFYEYRVGVDFINDMLNYYPCFLETYGMYEGEGAIKDTNGKYIMNKNCKRIIDTYADTNADTTLENSLFKRDSLKTTILTKFNNINILIQYLNNPISFEHFLTFKTKYAEEPSNLGTVVKKGEPEFEQEVYNILFQIYSVLAALGNHFTHYDLHWNNVQLHKVENDEYIDLIYYTVEIDASGVVHNAEIITPITIHTQYIVKIIDYGRCYYNNPFDASKNSVEFYNKICKPNNCTVDNGFHWFEKNEKKCKPINNTANAMAKYGKTCALYASDKFDTWLTGIIRGRTNIVNKINQIDNIYTIYKLLKDNPPTVDTRAVMGTMHIYLDRSKIMKFIKSSNVNTN